MNYDVIVLGSGPGGYVTAIKASQLGLKAAIVEKENLGGICLNWGCIPTKALLKSAQVFEYINHAEDFGITVKDANADFSNIIKRSRDVADGMSKGIAFLLKKNKVEVINGYGKIKKGNKVSVTADGKSTDYTAKHIIIATGARSRELPNLPQDGKKVIGYREALSLPTAPKKMVIVGSGAIGVEFAYFYSSMGTDVIIVEFMPNIVPLEDVDVSKQLQRSFKKSGIKIMTKSSVEKVIEDHYHDQLKKLGKDEMILKAKIEKFKDDEINHKNIAYESGATNKGFYSAMDKLIKTGSKIAITISEKI